MNCLLFSECTSIKCCKKKARLSSQRIRTTKNHWNLKNLIFKANLASKTGKRTRSCEIKFAEKLQCLTRRSKTPMLPRITFETAIKNRFHLQ